MAGSRNVTNPQTHKIAEYPKWVDGILYRSEEDELESGNQAEKDRMVKELKETYGKTVDLRQYKGSNGFGALKAYYEAVVAREGSNDDSGEDSQ